MNKKTGFSAFVTAVVAATGLLLGTSVTQAADVQVDGNGNVIRVTNLEIQFEPDRSFLNGFYDVEFITDTGTDIYGTVPFDPFANRIIVEFTDGGNVVRGSTSVAVHMQ